MGLALAVNLANRFGVRSIDVGAELYKTACYGASADGYEPAETHPIACAPSPQPKLCLMDR